MFKPNAQQMSTAIGIQHRIITNINGASKISYSTASLNYCNWKGMGGTDTVQNGTIVVIDTATLTMWYTPNLNEKDRILKNNDANLAYEVENVEDIENRHMWLIVKVKRTVIA